MEREETTELLIAVLTAASEQMDVDRLLVALHRQHNVYAQRGAPAVASAIAQIGAALTAIANMREKNRGPRH